MVVYNLLKLLSLANNLVISFINNLVLKPTNSLLLALLIDFINLCILFFLL